jgi:hypothetical protein
MFVGIEFTTMDEPEGEEGLIFDLDLFPKTNFSDITQVRRKFLLFFH